jgi:hypothetical protein
VFTEPLLCGPHRKQSETFLPSRCLEVGTRHNILDVSEQAPLPDCYIVIRIFCFGCAIAQAVSRWLPTAVARVQSRVWSSGICGGQSGAGADFLRVLRFPLPFFIPPTAPQSPSPIIWG